MAIVKNPYGVGYSGERVEERPRECVCCKIEFLWKGPPSEYAVPQRCQPCHSHSYDTADAELAALREHSTRLPTLLEHARQMTRKAHSERDRARTEVQESRRQVAAALQTRDKWREIVDAITSEHYGVGKACACKSTNCNVPEIVETIRESHRQRDTYWRHG